MEINIKNLIGKVEIHYHSNEPQEVVGLGDAISEIIGGAVADISQVPAEDEMKEKANKYAEAIPLLNLLIKKAELAVFAIENNKPNWEICQLAVEDIDELTEQIGNAITGGYFHKLREKDKELMKECLRLDGEIHKVPPQSPHTP